MSSAAEAGAGSSGAFDEVLARLARQPSLRHGPLEAAFARIVEVGAEVVGVARSNIWLLEEDGRRLRCVVHYERDGDVHSRLPDLDLDGLPGYVEALEGRRTLAVTDCSNDPRTAQLVTGYADEGELRALLDAPIIEGGVMVGAVRFESREPRSWEGEEARFAGCLADFAALALAGHRRRQTEAALGARDAWVSELLEHVGDAVLTMTAEGIVTYVSPSAARLGLPAARLEGRSWRELVLAEDVPRVRETVLALLQAGGVREVSYRVDTTRGVRWHQSVVSVMARPEHEPLVVVVARDVTDQREAERRTRALEQELLRSQRLESVGRLAGGVAHEFNNLLSVIGGNIDLARLQEDPQRAAGALTAAGQATQRAARLTRQLLAFGRRQRLEVQTVEIPRLFDDLGAMLHGLLRENVRLEWRVAERTDPVRADPAQIEQVIVNLAVNAVDAMPDGGELRVEAETVTLAEGAEPGLRAGRWVRIAVIDTGVGIPEDVIGGIFEPFFTTKADAVAHSGSGLGLAVSRGIVEQHGGTLRARSTPGVGSTFTLWLPATEHTGSTSAPDEDAGSLSSSPGIRRLLVVEDEPELLELMREILTSAGYAVTGVTDPRDGLALTEVTGTRFDALVTDVVMPGMSGPALFRRMQVLVPDVRVLFVSGYPGDELDGEQQRAAFLHKPFDAPTLTHRVRELLIDTPDEVAQARDA